MIKLAVEMLQSQINNKGLRILGRDILSIKDLDPANWQGLENVFENLPNQTKALFLSFSTSNSASTKRNYSIGKDPLSDGVTGAGFRLHHMNLARIEYLSGFKRGGEKTFIKAPEWKLLKDFETMSSIKVLCRIVPQGNNKYYRLPIYNEYFIVDMTKSANYATAAAAKQKALDDLDMQLEDSSAFENTEFTGGLTDRNTGEVGEQEDDSSNFTPDDVSDIIY